MNEWLAHQQGDMLPKALGNAQLVQNLVELGICVPALSLNKPVLYMVHK